MHTQDKMNSSKRLSQIDGLRGISALLVVVYHFFFQHVEIYTPTQTLFYVYGFGKYGVKIFFMISGFLILMSLENSKNSLAFIIGRFFRLYPVFWVCVSLTFIFVLVFGLEGREVSFENLVLNLTMIPGVLRAEPVDGVYWTLLYELKFYAILAFVFFVKLDKRISVLCFVYVAFILLVNHFKIDLRDIYSILNFVLMPKYGPLFVYGMITYKIYKGDNTLINYITAILSSVVIVVYDDYSNYPLIMVGCITIFTLSVFGKLLILDKKVFFRLGVISYPLYLLHQNIGYIIINYCLDNGFGRWPSAMLAIVFTISLASIVSIYIERPVMRFYYKCKQGKFKLGKEV